MGSAKVCADTCESEVEEYNIANYGRLKLQPLTKTFKDRLFFERCSGDNWEEGSEWLMVASSALGAKVPLTLRRLLKLFLLNRSRE